MHNHTSLSRGCFLAAILAQASHILANSGFYELLTVGSASSVIVAEFECGGMHIF